MNRIQQFQQRFFPSGVDAVLITDGIHRRYLLGFPSSAGTLVLFPETAYFVIDFRYIEAARQVVADCEILLQDRLGEQLQEIFTRHGVRKIGFEDDRLTVAELARYQAQFSELEFVAESGVCPVLKKMRLVKSAEELASLTAAQRIAEQAFQAVLQFIRAGVSEKQVAAELEYRMKCAGADDKSFDTICVAGAHSALPHGVPGDYRLKQGDFVTMDFGALVDGYHSDMTRTVAIGSVSEEQRYVYDSVLEAQLRGIAAIRPGVKAAEVDAAARRFLEEEQGFAGKFGHGLGHGVGMEIHEAPGLSFRSDEVLEENMVVTIEPGVYLPKKFGVRIEDFAIVGPNGAQIVTNCPKQLICL